MLDSEYTIFFLSYNNLRKIMFTIELQQSSVSSMLLVFCDKIT